MEYAQPNRCPVCGGRLEVTRLNCPTCSTMVSGKFQSCRYCLLDEPMQHFLEVFLVSRGNISVVGKKLSLSYPTVKSQLDELLATLFPEQQPEQSADGGVSDILDRMEKGELTAGEAAGRLARLKRTGS